MSRKTPDGQIDALAVAVARGQSVSAAARSLGLQERNARRISTTVEFKNQVKDIRASVISQSVGALGVVAVKAISVLRHLLEYEDEDIKLKASKELLANMLAVREHADLSARIDALEAERGTNGTRRTR